MHLLNNLILRVFEVTLKLIFPPLPNVCECLCIFKILPTFANMEVVYTNMEVVYTNIEVVYTNMEVVYTSVSLQ